MNKEEQLLVYLKGFSDIAAYLTLGSGGKVVLHTKTDVEIGDEENECNQDTQENNIGY